MTIFLIENRAVHAKKRWIGVGHACQSDRSTVDLCCCSVFFGVEKQLLLSETENQNMHMAEQQLWLARAFRIERD